MASTKRSATTRRQPAAAKRSAGASKRSASRADGPKPDDGTTSQPVTYISVQQRRERVRAGLRKFH
ncbi:MAG TPA: hypothetical protein VIP98_11260 [Microlunatus sp.]